MKTSEALYQAAEEMRRGFDPLIHPPPGPCGCFYAAIRFATGANDALALDALKSLEQVINIDDLWTASTLIDAGWEDVTATDDAVAALQIAADIAAAEGK